MSKSSCKRARETCSDDEEREKRRKKAYEKRVMTRSRAVGECGDNCKHNHDYLHCKLCKVIKKLCNLKECPCHAEGYLIEIQGKKNCFAHQTLNENKSRRVYATRKKRSIDIINGVSNKKKKKNKEEKEPELLSSNLNNKTEDVIGDYESVPYSEVFANEPMDYNIGNCDPSLYMS